MVKKAFIAVAISAFVLSAMSSGVFALEWSDAPEPSSSGDVMWAEIYQTPEGSGFGLITTYACGPKSQYGKAGTTGGQNLGGGDRLGTRYIYFADTCGASQAPTRSAFNRSTYVFTLSNNYTRYAGALVAPTTTTTTTTTTTVAPSTTTSTTVRRVTTTTLPTDSDEKDSSTTTLPSGRTTTTTIARRGVSTTISEPIGEDDGESEDDYAELSVRNQGTKFQVQVFSSFVDTDMIIRAKSSGKATITWRFATKSSGNYKFVTNRVLSGYVLSLWINDERVDSLRIR